MIRIGIVDDHAVVRAGLKQHFAEQVDFRVVGEAADAPGAIELACSVELDVLLLDLQLRGTTALDAVGIIAQRAPGVRILVLSGYPDEVYAATLMGMGARGYVNKSSDIHHVITAIRTVAMGGKSFTSTVTTAAQKRADKNPGGQPYEALSAREMEVFLQLAKGSRLSDVAHALAISIKTASTYRARVLEKLSLDSNQAMTHYAMGNGLIV